MNSVVVRKSKEPRQRLQSTSVSRRRFLTILAGSGAAAVLTACAPRALTSTAAPGSTQSTTPPPSTMENTSSSSTAYGMRKPGSGALELLYWDKGKAYEGYTLFGIKSVSFLIDMDGGLIHTWPIGTNPKLLDNGNLLDTRQDEASGLYGFRELDWDGNIVWEYYESRPGYTPHHDFVRIYNKKLAAYTTLYIARKLITNEQAIAAGSDPANGPYDNSSIDVVVEVDMAGNIVWEWSFWEHLVQDIDPARANYIGEGETIADYPGRLNINLPGSPLKADWLHSNSLDYNQELDQVVINVFQGEFYVIDHGNTFIPGDAETSVKLAAGSAGDFLYRFGDPARYQQGEPPAISEDWTSAAAGNKQLGASHDVEWIRPGLPGEGHFLAFNNGCLLFEIIPQSYVFEINGYLGAQGNDTGDYVNPPDAGYYTWHQELPKPKQPKQMSNQIVWIYTAKSSTAFFSQIVSSCQRLPNGNTLICVGVEGHIFEVTAAGELVWDYINPVADDHGILSYVPDGSPGVNAIFRAHRYGAEHPAFAGRTLVSGGSISACYRPG